MKTRERREGAIPSSSVGSKSFVRQPAGQFDCLVPAFDWWPTGIERGRDRERGRDSSTLLTLSSLLLASLHLASVSTNCQSVGITVHILHPCILATSSQRPRLHFNRVAFGKQLMKSRPSAALIVCGMQHAPASCNAAQHWCPAALEAELSSCNGHATHFKHGKRLGCGKWEKCRENCRKMLWKFRGNWREVVGKLEGNYREIVKKLNWIPRFLTLSVNDKVLIEGLPCNADNYKAT